MPEMRHPNRGNPSPASQSAAPGPAPLPARTAFLIVDTESIPDGALLSSVKYPGLGLSAEQAIDRARAEARDHSYTGSDFLPHTFQIPVAVCIARVGSDFSLQKITCIDAPLFRPAEVVKQFWSGIKYYEKCKLVTFNGRTFDLPLLELAAYRHGLPAREYFGRGRNRYNGDLDLMEWMTNFGACKLNGGLDLLAKLIGKPGKMDVSGSQVYDMYRAGRIAEINDYCTFDTLDTYFVFLRTRVMTGEITPEQETRLVAQANDVILAARVDLPALQKYLDGWKVPGN
jgi:3'-5' exonuclease